MHYIRWLHHQRHSLQWQSHPGKSHSYQQNSTNFLSVNITLHWVYGVYCNTQYCTLYMYLGLDTLERLMDLCDLPCQWKITSLVGVGQSGEEEVNSSAKHQKTDAVHLIGSYLCWQHQQFGAAPPPAIPTTLMSSVSALPSDEQSI